MIPPQEKLQGLLYNWTDDLPQCKETGVGYQTNLIYRAGGGMGATTDYEDRSFHFSCPGECFLYGVLDGNDGPMVADFAGQRLPAELLLGQIKEEYGDREVKQRLREAFDSVSKGFVEDLIDEPLMEKMNLETQLPEGMSKNDAQKRFPALFQRLEQLEKRIKGGCSAAIALIHKSRLFVANVGDARALLCRVDPQNEELGVIQLSTDHTIATNSELQRLANLGLNIERLQQIPIVLKTTRSLGDWALKGGYTSHPDLKEAREEPILSTPSVHGGEDILKNMKFLVLMSRGVYIAYEQATGIPKDQVNAHIANLIYNEILKQTTIENVAQCVIDHICRIHKEQFTKSGNVTCLRREDMTLLIRLFNIKVGQTPSPNVPRRQARPNLTPLKMPEKRRTPSPTSKPDTPSSTGSSTSTPATATPGSAGSATTSPQWGFPGGNQMNNPRSPSPLTVTFTEQQARPQPLAAPALPPRQGVAPPPVKAAWAAPRSNERNDSQNSMDDKTKMFNRPAEPLETDAEGRIKAYVSFDEFNEKIMAAGGPEEVFRDFLCR
ncbi:TGF-beta-activated kinase 1 and MAP3K7-binding protein 1-like [Clytia hemisphaerica]|eukprot:TCONS_00058564-protein